MNGENSLLQELGRAIIAADAELSAMITRRLYHDHVSLEEILGVIWEVQPRQLNQMQAVVRCLAELDRHLAPVPHTGTCAIIGIMAPAAVSLECRLVDILLRKAGVDVIDLGVKVTPAEFLQATDEHNPQVVIAVSATGRTWTDEDGEQHRLDWVERCADRLYDHIHSNFRNMSVIVLGQLDNDEIDEIITADHIRRNPFDIPEILKDLKLLPA